MVSRADSNAGVALINVRETVWETAWGIPGSASKKGRQALAADLKMFIGGTCLRLAFLFLCRSFGLLPGDPTPGADGDRRQPGNDSIGK
jgi:hypothetical protein